MGIRTPQHPWDQERDRQVEEGRRRAAEEVQRPGFLFDEAERCIERGEIAEAKRLLLLCRERIEEMLETLPSGKTCGIRRLDPKVRDVMARLGIV